MALLVYEIFKSIQGESIYSGRPCVFIRLTGCNLRCAYCDTNYAYDEGVPLSISDIVKKVKKFKSPLVEVTGGEPLLQPETPRLIERLLDASHEVMLETNGSLDVSSVDRRCMKILDIKCPSSGESHRNFSENVNHLTHLDQVKFVIGSLEDYEYAKGFLPKFRSPFPAHHILFSPVSGKMPLDVLAEWILKDNLQVRLHMQLHKFVWPGVERGR